MHKLSQPYQGMFNSTATDEPKLVLWKKKKKKTLIRSNELRWSFLFRILVSETHVYQVM